LAAHKPHPNHNIRAVHPEHYKNDLIVTRAHSPAKLLQEHLAMFKYVSVTLREHLTFISTTMPQKYTSLTLFKSSPKQYIFSHVKKNVQQWKPCIIVGTA